MARKKEKNVRFSPDVQAAIESIARVEYRNFSNCLEYLVVLGIKAWNESKANRKEKHD